MKNNLTVSDSKSKSDNITSREKVLKNIRRAIVRKTNPKDQNIDFETYIFKNDSDDVAMQFAQNFLALNGKFAFCENLLEVAEHLISLATERQWHNMVCYEQTIQDVLNKIEFPYSDRIDLLESADACFTGCEALVGLTGSILVSSKQKYGRGSTVLPHIHIVVAYTSQLQPDLKSAMDFVRSKYKDVLPSMLSFISGPSRTADIEKTLVQGAHGPKEIYIFLVQDSE